MRSPEQQIRGEPYEFGAYRPKLPTEEANPKHVQDINGIPHVPARIYGPKKLTRSKEGFNTGKVRV